MFDIVEPAINRAGHLPVGMVEQKLSQVTADESGYSGDQSTQVSASEARDGNVVRQCYNRRAAIIQQANVKSETQSTGRKSRRPACETRSVKRPIAMASHASQITSLSSRSTCAATSHTSRQARGLSQRLD